MNSYLRVICLVCVLFSTAFIAYAQPGGSKRAVWIESFRSLSDNEMRLLITDVLEKNPKALERISEPEVRRAQLTQLKELLAFATQAIKEGLADEPLNAFELANIRTEVFASGYDKRISKGKPELPAFGYVSDTKVAAFWKNRSNEGSFDEFRKAKLALLYAESPGQAQKIGEAEIAEARMFFAKMHIREAEYKAQKALLPKAFTASLEVQTKLQQASFLARLYSEISARKTEASNAEIDAYIAEHPELDTAKKKVVAEEVLKRALSGEDFAKLANEFTEDPGNISPTGQKVGGIYKNVRTGVMVAPFEAGALEMEPGQVNPKLVETDFGYHIVKLEKKTSSNDGEENVTIYDVRHILFATGFKDPDNPTGQDIPIRQYVKAKIESKKESDLLEQILADSNITIPADFTVPAQTATTAAGKKPARKPLKRRR